MKGKRFDFPFRTGGRPEGQKNLFFQRTIHQYLHICDFTPPFFLEVINGPLD